VSPKGLLKTVKLNLRGFLLLIGLLAVAAINIHGRLDTRRDRCIYLRNDLPRWREAVQQALLGLVGQ